MDETSAPSVPVHFDEQRFGERIRELRTERGLSLRALAQRLGISASALSQIERGKMRPAVTRLYQIMTELDGPMASVFADADARAREGAAAGAPPGSSPGAPGRHPRPALPPG